LEEVRTVAGGNVPGPGVTIGCDADLGRVAGGCGKRLSARARILVLGAGVSGLSSAHELLARGHAVTLWTRDDPMATTSTVAAALWYPFEAGPPERVAAWAARSYARFVRLAREETPGVRLERLVDLHAPAQVRPAWVAALEGHRPLAGRALAGYAQGWEARVPVIEMPLYLPWLLGRVRELGGKVERRAVRELAEARGFDALVNCTGLAARELCRDRECFPIRGQIVRVERGTVECALYFRDEDGSFGYVVPRSRDCVLGGTAERGVDSLAVDDGTTRTILARCRALEPRLASVPASVAVGLRPGRSAIRLERELLDGKPLVHDYGHGGCGVTLSWPCAEDVRALLEEALE
jgi:D-amino-acid oxidase